MRRIPGTFFWTLFISVALTAFSIGCSDNNKGTKTQTEPETTAEDSDSEGSDSEGSDSELKDGSPVRIVQHTNSAPADIDEQELAALGESQFVIGIDDHGYGMVDGDTDPASHSGFGESFPDIPHIGYYGGTDMYPGWCTDERFSVGDLHEDLFFHSTDPASLNIISTEEELLFYWIPDDRADPAIHVQYCTHKNLYQVVDYVIESADNESGPFTTVDGLSYAAEPNSAGAVLAAQCASCDSSRYYRVRSLLQESSDTRLIEYSWPQQPSSPSGPVIAWGYTSDLQTFHAMVYAPNGNLPADSEVLVEQPGLLDAGLGGLSQTVGTASSHSSPQTNFALYTGQLSLSSDSFRWARAYRFKTGTNSLPAGRDAYSVHNSSGTYNLRRNNNRILTQFNGQAVKPFHSVQKELILKRLTVLQKNGALGSYLDFYHDNIHGCVSTCYDADGCSKICSYQDNRAWTSEREENEHGFYMLEQAADALAYFKQERPGVFLALGFHMVSNQAKAAQWFSPHSDGAHVEYFAFNHQDAPILERIHFGFFEHLIEEAHIGNRKYFLMSHFASHYTADFSTAAKIFQRETSLGAYLLVAHMNVYLGAVVQYNYRQVPYFPEWRVPLGAPEKISLDAYSDLFANGEDDTLLVRTFENGAVVFNNTLGRNDLNAGPQGYEQTYILSQPLRRMRISGGYDPILHDPSQNRVGNGNVNYDEPTVSVTLAPGEAAIFVRDPL